MSSHANQLAYAQDLHRQHCLKYGIEPDWNKVGSFGRGHWMRKARTKMKRLALPSREDRAL